MKSPTGKSEGKSAAAAGKSRPGGKGAKSATKVGAKSDATARVVRHKAAGPTSGRVAKKAAPNESNAGRSTSRSGKSATRKAANKTVATDGEVGAFIASVADPRRRADADVIVRLMAETTGEAPVMWGASIIGFGRYRYRYESGREGEMLAVGFSPRKANMVLYVLGSIADDDPLLGRLGKFRRGKACLYVNGLADVDEGALRELVLKSFEATIAKWGRA